MIEVNVCEQLVQLPDTTPAVLCSLVEWKGSVPRKDYPVMVVTQDKILGTIGGGKMEYDVITLARDLLGSDEVSLQRFELTNREALEEGSLCGGTTRILLEPFSTAVQTVFRELHQRMKTGGGILVTKLNTGEPLTVERFILEETSTGKEDQEFRRQVEVVLQSGRPQSFPEDDQFLLVERILTPPRFHIFGAGHVGQAVADLAKFIELDTVVYDDRPDLLSPDRFPQAHRILLNYERTFEEQIILNREDLVLVATPGHFHDLELLRWVLGRPCAYVGLISSKRKWAILRDQLIKEGHDEQAVDRIHSPVGLNIEAETVPEIAVSILAEVILHLRKRGKDRTKIHEV